MDIKDFVVKYLEDEEFHGLFPEFEKQYVYYESLMKKKNSSTGCGGCTLNKIRATEVAVYDKIVANGGYYKRFEDFLSTKEESIPDAKSEIKPKPKVDDDYIAMKRLVNDNFYKLPISKTRFVLLLTENKYREFVFNHKELKELVNTFLSEYKTGKDLTNEIKSQIDILYDLIYSNTEILEEFKTMHEEISGKIPEKVLEKKPILEKVGTEITIEAPKPRPAKLEVIKSNSLEELEIKVSDFIQDKIMPMVSITKVGKKYLGTITYR